MITNVNHYTLAVSNIETSFHFYRDILGLKPLCKWPKGAYFLVGDFWFCLNLDHHRKPEPDAHYTHFAFSVNEEDFQPMIKKLLNAGVKSFKDSKDGYPFYFLDPDGYKLELHVGTWQDRLKEKKQNPWPDTQFFD
jgi:glutathione S-transferase fosA5